MKLLVAPTRKNRMNKLKIAAAVLGFIITLPANAKEYIGFNLCNNANMQSIKDIAAKHKTSDVSEIVRDWSVNDVAAMLENYKIGEEAYSVSLQLYKGKVIEVGVRNPGKLLDYMTAKYGDKYNKKFEEHTASGVFSTKYYFNVKDDPSAQVIFIENKIGEVGNPYYALSYQCVDLYKNYKIEFDNHQKAADTSKANALGL